VFPHSFLKAVAAESTDIAAATLPPKSVILCGTDRFSIVTSNKDPYGREGEVAMKKILGCIGLSLVLFCGAAGAAAGEHSRIALTAFYENCVDKQIETCEYKRAMLDSRSEMVRYCAIVALQQADYLKRNRKDLVQEMLKLDIGFKDYKVYYYLNKRFYESLPVETVAASAMPLPQGK
jgi:hypothetical protein